MAEETLDQEETTLITEPVVEETPAIEETPAEPKTEAKPEAKAEVKAEAKTKTEVDPDWPADWREKAAGGDAKVLSRLSRYASPKAIADALIAAQNRISQGDLKPILKKDATPDQIKEYRESLGIPETPDKYDLTEFKIQDKDNPLIKEYLQRAHATNQTPEQVKAGVESYFEIAQKVAETRANNDALQQRETEDVLRGEWGDEFRRNITLVKSFLDNAPEGFKERFLTGRMSDGKQIGSDPEALRWLLQLELERNPQGVITPGAGANLAQSVNDEIKQIEKVMQTDRKAYNKDEVLQERYRKLLEYRIQNEQKSKKAA